MCCSMAFLHFDTPEQAAACAAAGSVEVDGNSMNVELARPKKDFGNARGGRGGGFRGGRFTRVV